VRVLHLYPITDNIGDKIIKDGISAIYKNITDTDSTRKRTASDNIEAKILQADEIYIGGSNLLDFSLNDVSPIQFDKSLLKNKRYHLIGVGAGSPIGTYNMKESKAAIKLISYAKTCSIRDMFTYDMYKHLPNVSFINCPSLSFPYITKKRGMGSIVVLPPRRLLKRIESVHKILIKKIINENDMFLINSPNDKDVLEYFNIDKAIYTSDTREYFKIIDSFEKIISFRVHGAMAGVKLKKDVFLYCYDARMLSFAKTYNIKHREMGK